MKHRAVLEELSLLNTLELLVDVHADLSSIIETIAQQFIKFVANITWILTSSAEYTITTFVSDSRIMHEQLRKASLLVNNSIEVYGSVWSHYYALNETTFQKGQPSNLSWFFVYLGEGWWSTFAWANATRNILIPFEKTLAKRDKAQRGIRAWEREYARLVQVSHVIQEMTRGLHRFEQGMDRRDCSIPYYC
ncbi:MAG: hypothetical protein LQ338_005535 [Usnochroma carphineum]|nr:MAG: hypothetical protein LQ338_005535 [Usnochroma carphineum]